MLKKRSITLLGHPTSVALEPEFWEALEGLARAERSNLTALIGRIDEGRAGRLGSISPPHCTALPNSTSAAVKRSPVM